MSVSYRSTVTARGPGVLGPKRHDPPEARDVMVTAVRTVNADDTLLDAVEKMLGAELRHLPVIDEEDRPVGMLSERDLRSALGDLRDFLTSDARPPRSASERVDEVMTPNPICVRYDTSLEDVAQS